MELLDQCNVIRQNLSSVKIRWPTENSWFLQVTFSFLGINWFTEAMCPFQHKHILQPSATWITKFLMKSAFSKFLALVKNHADRDNSCMTVPLPGMTFLTVSVIPTLRHHLDRLWKLSLPTMCRTINQCVCVWVCTYAREPVHMGMHV